jgi:hypothetical protein
MEGCITAEPVAIIDLIHNQQIRRGFHYVFFLTHFSNYDKTCLVIKVNKDYEDLLVI